MSLGPEIKLGSGCIYGPNRISGLYGVSPIHIAFFLKINFFMYKKFIFLYFCPQNVSEKQANGHMKNQEKTAS